MAELVLLLSDPGFSGEQCSPGSVILLHRKILTSSILYGENWTTHCILQDYIFTILCSPASAKLFLRLPQRFW